MWIVTPKVISLVPSMTETLLEWGIEPLACTRFCEQPGLLHVGGTKDPDLDAIIALAPDLVIVDAEENRIEDHDALLAAGLSVHTLRVRSVQDVADQLAPLAARLEVDWCPPRFAPPPAPTLSAFVPIWKRPWMALGAPTYGASVLAQLGVEDVFAADGPYCEIELADAMARQPDLVIAPDEPYPFGERHLDLLGTVAPVLLVDGADLLWWGARTSGAIERLGSLLSELIRPA